MRRSPTLGVCVAAALLMHIWVVARPWSWSQPSGASAHARPIPAQTPGRLSLRLLQQPTGGYAAHGAVTQSASSRTAEQPQQQSEPIQFAMASHSSNMDSQATDGALSDGLAGAVNETSAHAVESYRPLAALDEAPRLLADSPISIAYPDATLPSGSAQTTVALWINAGGTVDEVRPLADTLPPRFSQAVRQAFQQLRFEAGRLNGTASPAELCLQVYFREGEPTQWEWLVGPAEQQSVDKRCAELASAR